MTQVSRGNLTILDWDNAADVASALTDDSISVNLLDDPNLHDHLLKGLHVLGLSTQLDNVGWFDAGCCA